ncbi:hypothetical protein [Aestuariimicrobium sp. T2.26MG-19.2B]|uniref:hypothetical protein n=1 Tax=Aestuariimicrobium sp. T2.26MG-19.2B TaxID=3040679 RepID=UPI0024777BC9|nr:hypothetical protein [Aestuariimicrobium sp. T2.26MG-19.2B]CAI9406517.1 hypothetical protein AESSP_01641 [Aestuariimicrobium sp. T2.26MG-19.2B]
MTPDLRLAGAGGEVRVRPERGAKLTSLRSPDGLEWLSTGRESWSGPGFTESEMGGWDECAPTISAGRLQDGRTLGDHGDVWDEPWRVVRHDAGELTCEVDVPGLGFSLRRRITPTGAGFRLDYRARSLPAAPPLPFLWAAHPQFIAPERLVVPHLREVLPTHPVAADAPVPWGGPPPMVATGAGPSGRPADEPRAKKVWAHTPRLPAEVVLGREGWELVLGWGGAPLRSVALWFDPAEYAGTPVVAVEPATGAGDDVSRLVPGDEVAVLSHEHPLDWWVELSFRRT